LQIVAGWARSETDKTQINLALIEGVVLLGRCHVEQI
jgi:hypothetical protein